MADENERLISALGAHGTLKSIYADPNQPTGVRVKAAIGCLQHEVPKLTPVPPAVDLVAEEIEPLAVLVERRRARQDALCPESAALRGDFKTPNLLPAGHGEGGGDDSSD